MDSAGSAARPTKGGKRRQRRGASSSERAIRPSPCMGKGTGAGGHWMRDLRRYGVLAFIVTIITLAVTTTAGDATTSFAGRSLDGSGNNPIHPQWGGANTLYLRVAPTNYADGISTMPTGPSIRYVSNRIFNDVGQNIFSKDGVTQWGGVWGQFVDHDFGLRDERPAETAPIAFDAADPLEAFTNDFGAIGFARTPAAPGTGVSTPRQQVNTLN